MEDQTAEGAARANNIKERSQMGAPYINQEMSRLQETFSTVSILELKRYNIFNWLSSKNELALLAKVKLAYVFLNTGIIVTTDDEVYSIGQLGGTLQQTVNLTKVPELCGKGVKEFVAGSNEYCFALTETGVIYSWGKNAEGQLGLGDKEASLKPKIIQGDLKEKNIVQTVASKTFALALDNDGEVYGWGDGSKGQIGLGLNESRLSPTRIPKGCFRANKITQIAVCQYFSVGLCQSGELLKWGGNNAASSTLQLITCSTTVIFKEIVSGDRCVWVLSESGDAFCFNGSTYSKKSQLGHGVVLDVASDPKVGMFAFEHYQGIFCNGGFGGEVRRIGQCTNFTSLDQVFAARAQITYRTLTPSQDKPSTEFHTGRSITEDITRAWNDEQKKDVTFVVQEKTVRANKAILSLRSDYFEKMFSGQLKESLLDSGSIVIHDTKYDAFYSLLYCLYHDQLDDCSTDYEPICDVMQLADSYCEFGIRTACEAILMRKITNDSALHLLKFASLVNATALEERVFQYVVSNRKEITKLCPNPGDLENEIGKEAYDKLMLALLNC